MTWTTVFVALGALTALVIISGVLYLAAKRQFEIISAWRSQPDPQIPEVTYSETQLVTSGQLMFEGPRWRARTVRRLAFVTPTSMHAQVSIDLVIPSVPSAQEPMTDGQHFPPTSDINSLEPALIPLFLVEKRKLASIDLRDEGGRAVPILSRRDEAHLSALLLLSYWAELFPSAPIEAGSQAEKQLSSVIGGSPADAQMSWMQLVNTLDTLASHPQGGTARSHLKEYCGLVHGFIRHSHLFAYLQDARPDQRRILKLSFDVDEPWFSMSVWRSIQHLTLASRWPLIRATTAVFAALSDDDSVLTEVTQGRQIANGLGLLTDSDSTLVSQIWAAVKGFGLGLLSRLGFTSRRIRGTFSQFRAASEHLVVEAPPGTYFTGGILRAAGQEAQDVDAVSRGTTNAHLYCSERNEADYEFTVRLRARRRGWLMSALVTTATITCMLLFAWTQRSVIRGHAGAATAIAAAALGLGTVAVAYLIRPGEHPMTTRLLEGPRLALVASGLAALAGIMLLAVGEADPSTPADWSFHEQGWIAVVVAALSLAIICGNYLGSALGWLVAARTRLTDFGELRTNPFSR